MVDYSLPLFQNPPEVWDAAKCAKMAKRTARDGMGTPYPFKGYIGDSHYGQHHYNGGCVRNGKWWQGENNPLPLIAKGYEIVRRPS